MIKEIPTFSEFREAGVMYLNLALDNIFDLYLARNNVLRWNQQIKEYDIQETLEDNIRTAYQYNLFNAASLVQQGLEMLLKAYIVNISPYLLISNNYREWPKSVPNSNDIFFADFKTSDAMDLMPMFTAVTGTKLKPQFTQMVTDSRRRRNRILHTYDKTLSVIPLELVKFVIEIAVNLLPEKAFVEERRKYLDKRETQLIGTMGYGFQVIIEGEILFTMLTKSELGHFYGVIPTSRWYCCSHCANCYNDHSCGDKEFRTAQLSPNTPDSRHVKCCVCGESTGVLRVQCNHCEGNVIQEEYCTCLLCGGFSDIEE